MRLRRTLLTTLILAASVGLLGQSAARRAVSDVVTDEAVKKSLERLEGMKGQMADRLAGIGMPEMDPEGAALLVLHVPRLRRSTLPISVTPA